MGTAINTFTLGASELNSLSQTWRERQSERLCLRDYSTKYYDGSFLHITYYHFININIISYFILTEIFVVYLCFLCIHLCIYVYISYSIFYHPVLLLLCLPKCPVPDKYNQSFITIAYCSTLYIKS